MDLIEDLDEKSHGGICGNMILVVDCNANHVVPDIIQDRIVGGITLSGEMEWLSVFGQDDKFQFSENPVNIGGSIVYQSQLKAVISKDKILRLRAIDKLMRVGHIIKFTDSNHITKLIGGVRKGAYLTWTRDNKESIEQANEIPVVWTWTNDRPVPELIE